MRFFGIECKGKLILQKVSALPTFDATRDEGRLVYNETDGNTYIGDSTRWKMTGGVDDSIDITTATASEYEGQVVYYNNEMYYSDGTDWKKITDIDDSIDNVLQPVNDSPANSATGTLLYPTLETTGYFALYGATQQASQ